MTLKIWWSIVIRRSCLSLVKGELPDVKERKRNADLSEQRSLLHYDMQNLFRPISCRSPSMSILAAMSVSLSAFYPEMDDIDPEAQIDFAVTRLISKIGQSPPSPIRHMKEKISSIEL
jgi:citrate synthase